MNPKERLEPGAKKLQRLHTGRWLMAGVATMALLTSCGGGSVVVDRGQ